MSTQLTEDLREELARVVAQTPAPPTVALTEGAVSRGRAMRARRRAATGAVVVACVVAVVAPLAMRSDERATVPEPVPATSTPSAVAPTSPATPRVESWRVTERCPVGKAQICGDLGVTAIDVGGRTYRERYSGVQPLQFRFHSREVSMTVGDRDRARVLAGLLPGGPGWSVRFRAYVDGRLVGEYRSGRLWLLPVPPGRHQVRVSASAFVGGQARVVIGEFRRVP